MTGTADTEAYEFQEIYGLETVVIPPNKPTIRKDELDLVYKTAREKLRRGDQRHPRLPRARPAGAGGHDVDRELRADLRPAREGEAAAPGAQRQAARQGSRDRRAGRPPERDHDRHQHGRPRHRHRARRQRREAGAVHRGRRRACRPTRRRVASGSCATSGRACTSRSSPTAACASSPPSATSRAASTTSCAAARAARATRARRASTCRSKIR